MHANTDIFSYDQLRITDADSLTCTVKNEFDGPVRKCSNVVVRKKKIC